MSKIVDKKLGFAASPSPDVEGYAMYYRLDDGNPLNYSDTRVDIGVPPTQEYQGQTIHVVSLNDTIADLEEGTYLFGFAGYDGVGNEGTIVSLSTQVDVTAPDPVPFVTEVVG